MTTLDYLAGPGRQKPESGTTPRSDPLSDPHLKAAQGRQDEDDLAQEACLALLSALPSYQDMGRPFGAFVFAIAAHKVAGAARGAARSPLPVPVIPDLPDRCLGPEEL